jgi:signal transduction histidine kinase
MKKAVANNTAFTNDLQHDLELFRALKPYIRHCLALNHDINNPLAGIIGYCEFLQETGSNLSQEQRGYVQQILACAERIQGELETLCREKVGLSGKIDLGAFLNSVEKSAG